MIQWMLRESTSEHFLSVDREIGSTSLAQIDSIKTTGIVLILIRKGKQSETSPIFIFATFVYPINQLLGCDMCSMESCANFLASPGCSVTDCKRQAMRWSRSGFVTFSLARDPASQVGACYIRKFTDQLSRSKVRSVAPQAICGHVETSIPGTRVWQPPYRETHSGQ